MLACGCDEWPSFSRDSWQRARKPHTCEECGYKIKPGETYWRNFQVHWGDASSTCRCERCADLADAMRDLGYCDYLGGLFEMYFEWLDLDQNAPDAKERSERIWLKHRNWNEAI